MATKASSSHTAKLFSKFYQPLYCFILPWGFTGAAGSKHD